MKKTKKIESVFSFLFRWSSHISITLTFFFFFFFLLNFLWPGALSRLLHVSGGSPRANVKTPVQAPGRPRRLRVVAVSRRRHRFCPSAAGRPRQRPRRPHREQEVHARHQGKPSVPRREYVFCFFCFCDGTHPCTKNEAESACPVSRKNKKARDRDGEMAPF